MVVLLTEEVLIWRKDSALLLRLLDHRFLYSLSKLIKRVLCLESLAQRALQEGELVGTRGLSFATNSHFLLELVEGLTLAFITGLNISCRLLFLLPGSLLRVELSE